MSEARGLVYPGDKLGVEEEYLPGPGVYVDEILGLLRANLAGRVRRNNRQKVIRVEKPGSRIDYPRPGSIVTGVVTSIRDEMAVITLFPLKENSMMPHPLTGILHVSQVSTTYTKSLYDAISLGDLVKAKVLSSENPFQLTIKGPGLGVILSTCSRCGAVLRLKSKNKLECPKCGHIESRKTSSSYINLEKVF